VDFDVAVEPADGAAAWAENGNQLSNDVCMHIKR